MRLMITNEYSVGDGVNKTEGGGFRVRHPGVLLAMSVFIGTIAAGINVPIIEYIEHSGRDLVTDSALRAFLIGTDGIIKHLTGSFVELFQILSEM